jgi:hypothetical protein
MRADHIHLIYISCFFLHVRVAVAGKFFPKTGESGHAKYMRLPPSHPSIIFESKKCVNASLHFFHTLFSLFSIPFFPYSFTVFIHAAILKVSRLSFQSKIISIPGSAIS